MRQLVTQNVDGLHQRAGSIDVIELHGNLRQVGCIDCGANHSRESVQRTLEAENSDFLGVRAMVAPDGDVDVEPYWVEAFRVPSCATCGGVLKPDVVFFGEGVPRHRVDAASRALQQSDAMLVLGSSLMVYSGYRFCEWAHTMGIPIAAINLGRTRADHLFSLKIERPCADALGSLIDHLGIN
jgi:NAD-dependent SIR2 family protein deacetylase